MAALDLSQRSGASEIMDDERLGFEDFHRYLRELSQVNRLSLGHRPTLTWLRAFLRRTGNQRPVSILDVGFGYGDMLRRLRTWSAGRGIALDLHGVDINPWAKRAAEMQTPANCLIHYEAADIFDHPADRTYDVVISALFTHHLDDAALIRFIRWMQAHARLGWFINDLHRDRMAYHGAKSFLRLMGCDPMIRHDGPISVTRARTIDEWRSILAQAGLEQAPVEIGRYFPFRVGIGCLKQASPA